MTSVHRRLFANATTNPERYGFSATVLSLHFTTARPLEVKLRLPIKDIWPDYDGPGTYATWLFDRLYLRASAMVLGGKYGSGDVQCGIPPSGLQWLAFLRHHPYSVVCSTSPLGVIQFVAAVDQVMPDTEPDLDVDGCIAQLLGAES